MMSSVLTTVLTVIETLNKYAPVILQAGADIKPFAVDLYRQFKGSDVTSDERKEIEAAADALYNRLEEPLPPAQSGDPDYKP